MLSRHALWSPGLLFCNRVGGEFHFAWVCLEASHGQVLFFCKEAEPRGFVISAPPPRKKRLQTKRSRGQLSRSWLRSNKVSQGLVLLSIRARASTKEGV